MANRTDGVAEKLRLLETAYQAGRHDLAMSLAESTKDSLTFERQDEFPPGRFHAESGDVFEVKSLPQPWANWARGWRFCQAIDVFETIGVERVAEPIHVRLKAESQQLQDPWRELRVAQIRADGRLVEIRCQLLTHVQTKTEHLCELAFQANVGVHANASFLIFFGNPNAELPNYETDLRASGEGYGLDIENRHFKAELSRQMGQLERLTYKREHGLELYAGGKGHGEPPTLDWSNDYVDEGGFQKLRIRSWTECPNFEVKRGPVCVQVRRWGFPHSPLHPVFAPSRVHIDQTYTFYAGLPHFFKHGEMEAIQDVEISAMRDDEWVLSGYSFDQIVWLDRQGVVHEGKPPNEHANDLWGVGFYHTKSRDAFVALWLKHEADNFEGIQHNGSPTLHYDGHGQLWARYPARKETLQNGAVFRQQNAYLAVDYAADDGAEKLARLRHRLINPLEIQSGDLSEVSAAASPGNLARPGENLDLKAKIWTALREVQDEQLYQIDANIVDMGYIYDLRFEDGVVHILLTMPHRGRPVYEFLVTGGGGRVKGGIREQLLALPEVRDVVVHFTWDPAWNVHRMTPDCRERLEAER